MRQKRIRQFRITSVVRSPILASILLFCTFWTGTSSANDLKNNALQKFLSTHCFECHDDLTTEGGLNLLELGFDLEDAEVLRKWVLVHDKAANSEMPPPQKRDSPEDHDLKKFLSTLGELLTRSDLSRKEVVLRRLNRLEYEYTLRDLFSLPRLNVKDRLPEDAKAHGFDTIGEALALSTEQMLVYLEAADFVLDSALGENKKPESRKRVSNLKTSTSRVLGKLFRETEEGVVMFSSRYSPSTFRGFDIDQPGLYRFTLRARPFQSDTKMTVRVYAGDVIASRRDRWLVGHYELDPGEKWTEIKFEEFLQRYDSVKIVTYRNGGHENDAKITTRPGVLVGDADCFGPIVETWPPQSRDVLLAGVNPGAAAADDAAAIFSRLAPRIFRRPTAEREIAPFSSLVRAALAEDRPWMEAFRIGMKAMLVSPEFLFLDEPGREKMPHFALASRLSYFLWKSAPDRKLLSLAAEGQLGTDSVLRQQVERLLNDPRANRFIEDFTGQWLDLYEIDFTEPDKHLFPEYDELVRAGMLAESRGFFKEILEKNLSTAHFVDADWTILNSRLAEHYGVAGIDGLEYRKVRLPPGSPRGGILGQAAVHKISANGTNTSPVLRGVWLQENFFGTPVPPPPANVPAVEPDITGATSLREILVKHSAEKACQGCHRKIDPAGFALERFDPIGGWRDWYRSMGEGERVLPDRFIDSPVNKVRVRYKKGLPVDASGKMPNSFAFDDFLAFKEKLAENPEFMTRTLTEKLLTYGIGRGMGFSDRSVIDKIVNESKQNGHGFRDLIHLVVQSSLFQAP